MKCKRNHAFTTAGNPWTTRASKLDKIGRGYPQRDGRLIGWLGRLTCVLWATIANVPAVADPPQPVGGLWDQTINLISPESSVPYYPGFGNSVFKSSAPGAPANSTTLTPPSATIRWLSAELPAEQSAAQSGHSGTSAHGPELVPCAEMSSGQRQTPLAPDDALRGVIRLAPPPIETGDLAYPINLATALKLADARPLIISAAQAGAWVAEAKLQKAKVLWVPSFDMGSDYIRHDGFGPDFNLGINTPQRPLNQNVNFLYSGIGIIQNVALTDAIFEPLAARQELNSSRWEIQTAKNDALLDTANAYFTVHQYRGQLAGATDVVRRGHQLVERLQILSTDLIPRIEVDRGVRMLADMEQMAALARQHWRVSSADLTQVLRLDPRVLVVPQEHDHLQITLIEPNRTLDELIPVGLTNRPELASHQAMVQAVAQRIRREKGRILMPSIMLNGFQTPNELIQFGAQGIGHGDALNLWSLRDDLSPQAMYQWEAFGLGNYARIKEQRGEQSKSIIQLFKVQDAVAGDITRAQARLQSAAVRVIQAERSMHEALITFEGNYEGLAQTKRFGNVLVQIYRPQEAVVALQQLMTAYNQYFATVADYNRAQFELFHALGYPAAEVSAAANSGQHRARRYQSSVLLAACCARTAAGIALIWNTAIASLDQIEHVGTAVRYFGPRAWLDRGRIAAKMQQMRFIFRRSRIIPIVGRRR